MAKKNSIEVPVLNAFDNESIDFMIRKVEEELQVDLPILQKLDDQVKTAEELYLTEKAGADKVRAEVEKKKRWLEGLVAARNDESDTKVLRVLRPTSHTKKKAETSGERFSWVSAAETILKEAQTFMHPDDIYKKIVDKFPDVKKMVEEGGKGLRTRVTKNWERSSSYGKERKLGRQVLTFQHNRLGLFEWLREDGQIKGEYLKGVVFPGSKATTTNRTKNTKTSKTVSEPQLEAVA